MHLPIYFDGQLLRCLVIGGGPSVVRKIEAFVEAGAAVTVLARNADFKIMVLSSLARLKLEQRDYIPGECTGYDLLVVGSETSFPKLQIVEDARKNTVPLNISGEPGMSTFFFPATLREGDLTVAVSSGGTAPFMAVEFRRRLATAVKGWGQWVGLAGRFKFAVARNTKDPARRDEYYDKFLTTGPFQVDPEPSERTPIAEWLQILRHAKVGGRGPRKGYDESTASNDDPKDSTPR